MTGEDTRTQRGQRPENLTPLCSAPHLFSLWHSITPLESPFADNRTHPLAKWTVGHSTQLPLCAGIVSLVRANPKGWQRGKSF